MIEALDLAIQMRDKCKSSLDSLYELEEYLHRCQQHSNRFTKVDQEDKEYVARQKEQLINGRRLRGFLDSLPDIYDSLDRHDLKEAVSLYRQGKETMDLFKTRPVLLPSKTFDILIKEVSSSLTRCQEWIEYFAVDELKKIPEDEILVFHCLCALAILYNSMEDVLTRFLSTLAGVIDEAVESSDKLCEILPTVIRSLYFVLQFVSEGFVQRGVMEMLVKEFQVSGQDFSDQNKITDITKSWFEEQVAKIQKYLPDMLKKTVNLNEVFDGLSAVNALKMSKWNSFCCKSTGTTMNPWGDILRDACLKHFNMIVNKKTDSAFVHLNVSNVRDMDPNVSSFVWDQNDTDFDLKRKALVPGFHSILEAASLELISLSNQCQPLLSPERISFIFEQDVSGMRTNVVDSIQQKLESFVSKLDQTVKVQPSKVLPASFLLRSLALKCPSLKTVLAIGFQEEQYNNLVKWLLTKSRDWLVLHYFRRIETFSVQLLKVSDISVEQMTEGAWNWQEVQLKEEDSSGSFIRIPVFPSLQLIDFLTCLSREVNVISAYGPSDLLCIEVTVKASTEFLRVYQETLDRLSSSSLPDSIKQKKGVQCYFDLLFFRIIVKSIKDERLKTSHLPQINQLIKSFESHLDPFDLHLMSPLLQTHSLVAIKSTLQIISLFVSEEAVETLKKVTDSKDSSSSGTTKQDFSLVRPSHPPFQLLDINKKDQV